MRGLTLRDGVRAGLVGAVVSAAWGLVVSPILGTDVVRETRLAAVPLLGARALEPEYAALAFLVGGASHVAVSIAWGIVFALVCPMPAPLFMLAAGALFGVVVWLVMHHALLPLLGVGWIVAGFSTGRAITEHVVFGMAVAVGLFFVHPGDSARPGR